LHFFNNNDAKDLYRLCCVLDGIYEDKRIGLDIFNKYLIGCSFSKLVNVFTGVDPRLDELGGLEAFLKQVTLIEKFYEKIKFMLSKSVFFATNIVDTKSWMENSETDHHAPDVCIELKQVCNNKSYIYNSLDTFLYSWCKFNIAFSGLTGTEQHFLTNMPLGDDSVDVLLSGKVDIITDVSDDMLLKKHFTITNDGINIPEPSSKWFLISKGVFLNLKSQKGW
jgi:hypothetical protein